jgi:Holliday junction resolvasome RuvABC endonuclease subunit
MPRSTTKILQTETSSARKRTLRATFLSFDPGTSNHGYAVVKATLHLRSPPTQVQVLRFGRIHDTIRDLKLGVRLQVLGYKKILRKLTLEYQPTHFVAERYMSRRMGGTTIESVNLMLGAALGEFSPRIPVKVIPASQWKNEAKRQGIDLLALYAFAKEYGGITDHAVDAMMIGVYALSAASRNKPFADFTPEQLRALISKSKHEDLGTKPPRPSKRKHIRKKAT